MPGMGICHYHQVWFPLFKLLWHTDLFCDLMFTCQCADNTMYSCMPMYEPQCTLSSRAVASFYTEVPVCQLDILTQSEIFTEIYPLRAWNSLNTVSIWKSISLVNSSVSSVVLYCLTVSWCWKYGASWISYKQWGKDCRVNIEFESLSEGYSAVVCFRFASLPNSRWEPIKHGL